MPTPDETDIRRALADTLRAIIPAAVVVPRNIVDLMDATWLGLLIDTPDRKLRGWVVDIQASRLIEERFKAAVYEHEFSVWQVAEYETGTKGANSADEFARDRKAVIERFATKQLPDLLLDARVKPVSFPLIGVWRVGGEQGQPVHIAQGVTTATTTVGC